MNTYIYMHVHMLKDFALKEYLYAYQRLVLIKLLFFFHFDYFNFLFA